MFKIYTVKILKYLRYWAYRYIVNFYFKSSQLYISDRIKKIFNTNESFFGYYNLSPEDKKGCVLGLKPNNEKVDILTTKNNNEKEYNIIESTSAYNWQQGCMLQWSPQRENIIYFNKYDQNRNEYFTKILNIKDKSHSTKLSKPICCISNDETYALSLNFERLAVMRPDYGYFCNKNEIYLPDNDADGIWKIDLNTKKSKLIISLKRLIELKPIDTMKYAEHKVNHIDIAPDGNRFMFLHRWIGPEGRFMRLISADKDGNSLYILNGDIMTSHSCWFGNDKIISFCFTSEFGNGYTVFTDLTSERKLLSEKLPKVDGHPSVSPNGKWMITDSYPNHDRMAKMYLYNIINDEMKIIGRFYQPLRFVNENRIDLHPKWNMQGNKVYFESGHNGERNLYSIDLQNIV